MQIRRIAVIGAGPEGWQLAARAAQAGYRTTLEDVLPSNLRRAETGIRETLQREAGVQREAGLNVDEILSRIVFASTIDEAVREADLALDCLPDELESKLEIFSMLDRMAPPHTILCTPTEAVSIADIASCTYRAERCVAVKCSQKMQRNSLSTAESIVLVHSHWTLPEVIETTTQFWQHLGKSVVTEYDGSFAAL